MERRPYGPLISTMGVEWRPHGPLAAMIYVLWRPHVPLAFNFWEKKTYFYILLGADMAQVIEIFPSKELGLGWWLRLRSHLFSKFKGMPEYCVAHGINLLHSKYWLGHRKGFTHFTRVIRISGFTVIFTQKLLWCSPQDKFDTISNQQEKYLSVAQEDSVENKRPCQ